MNTSRSSSSSSARPGPPPTRKPSKASSSSNRVPVTALKPTPSNPATADKPKYARWKDAFKSGVGLYMSEEYEKAVEAFNEAANLPGGRSVLVLDSRAATLEKLGRIKEALLDAKDMVELAPEAHKGYVRGSHLYTLLKPPSYSRSVKLLEHGIPFAPAQLRPALQTKLATLRLSLHDQTTVSSKRRQNWTDRLPAELLVLIGEQNLQRDPDASLRLASVCRRWRDIALSTSSLWVHLRLAQRRPATKLSVFVERGNSRLQSVKASAFTLPLLEDLVSYLSNVTSFDLSLPGSVPTIDALKILRHSFSPKLRELKFEAEHRSVNPHGNISRMVYAEDIINLFQEGSGGMPTSELQSLKLANITGFLLMNHAQIAFTFPRLKRLFLSAVTEVPPLDSDNTSAMMDTFSGQAELEEISITGDSVLHVPPPVAEGNAPRPFPAVDLPHLKRFTCSTSIFNGLEDLTWNTPFLEQLDLSLPRLSTQPNLYSNILFPASFEGPQAHLTHLNLTRTALNEPLLIVNLRRLPALVDLQLGMCPVTNAVVEALTLPSADLKATSVDVCPQLQSLGLTHSEAISGGPLLRMVLSRLSPPTLPLSNPTGTSASPEIVSSPSSSDRAILRSLNIDACAGVEDKAVQYLRGKLESFSCRMPRAPKSGFADKVRNRF